MVTTQTEQNAVQVFEVRCELEGALQTRAADDLCTTVEELMRRGHRYVVLDLAHVTKIDAAGVGALVAAFCKTKAAGGSLRITHPQLRVRELLEMVGVFRVLTGDSESERTAQTDALSYR